MSHFAIPFTNFCNRILKNPIYPTICTSVLYFFLRSVALVMTSGSEQCLFNLPFNLFWYMVGFNVDDGICLQQHV